MNKYARLPLLLLASLLLAGCMGAVLRPPASQRRISDTHINHCISLCTSAGLELQSMVIVANQTGCVCSVADGQVNAEAAAAGGAVAVLIAQQQQQLQQR